MNPASNLNVMRCWLLSLCILLTYGCATSTNSVVTGSTHNLPHGMKKIDNSFWWRCKFRIDWPIDEEPDWAVSLLLAHAVVSPVLSQYADDIPYWRFHRRATRDRAGHQFSFIFYSTPEHATSVFEAINSSEVLKKSIQANIVRDVFIDDTKQPQRSNIGATSDQNDGLLRLSEELARFHNGCLVHFGLG